MRIEGELCAKAAVACQLACPQPQAKVSKCLLMLAHCLKVGVSRRRSSELVGVLKSGRQGRLGHAVFAHIAAEVDLREIYRDCARMVTKPPEYTMEADTNCWRAAKYTHSQADLNLQPLRVWPDHRPLCFQGSYLKVSDERNFRRAEM
jgi:hypothetical protein